ncbi:MAG TPA: DUF4287 domain-containing protein [Pyrinomonadaceae bacterium]|jgi:uncharacterized protein YndB with AHSA1/START domain|nr:DUF4287 domain-containing protein [Pyrinomonadaceae bacterium]
MPTKATTPRMSDDAVQAKTGKTWKEWFAILDKAGAKKLSHQEIVKYLHAKQGVGPWWQQMVTVNYERARGLRDVHQKPSGYEISVSRTINVPIAKLYHAFANDKARNAWLAEDGLAVRKATANKSMRVTWNDVKTSLEISFLSKGDGKSQVVVQHSKLPNAKASTTMKTYWRNALDRLRASLEK